MASLIWIMHVNIDAGGAFRFRLLNVRRLELSMQVMFFGHKDASGSMGSVSLKISAVASDITRTLTLSPRHFVPTVTKTGFFHKYAKDVQIGDKVMLVSGDSQVEGAVVGKEEGVAQGMFNPYTKV